MAALAHSSSRRGMSVGTPLTAKLLQDRQAAKPLECIGLEQQHVLFMIDLIPSDLSFRQKKYLLI